MLDVGGGGDKNLIDWDSCGSGLVGDDYRSEHVISALSCFVGGVGDLDAACFSSAAGVHLGFYDYWRAQFFGGGFGFSWRGCDFARQHGDSVFCEESLRLVFVDVHVWERFGFRNGALSCDSWLVTDSSSLDYVVMKRLLDSWA